jgi:hypothetical protein
MKRLPDIIRIVKCALGILLIVCFLLPWVAQTPSCADKSVIIRDNISGFTLVREGTAPEALAAPVFGAVVAALALAVRGRAAPLILSLVSLAEIPAAVFVAAYIDLAVRLFTPFVVRYGYVATATILWTIPVMSLAEIIVHFGRLARTGKVVIISAAGMLAALALGDYLSRFFR